MQRKENQQARRAKDPYLQQKILSANPVQLVSYMYDAVLAACRSEDSDRAQRGLLALIDSLNFEHADISMPMFQVYRYCIDKVRESKYDEVIDLIGGFKSAWSEAMNVN